MNLKLVVEGNPFKGGNRTQQCSINYISNMINCFLMRVGQVIATSLISVCSASERVTAYHSQVIG